MDEACDLVALPWVLRRAIGGWVGEGPAHRGYGLGKLQVACLNLHCHPPPPQGAKQGRGQSQGTTTPPPPPHTPAAHVGTPPVPSPPAAGVLNYLELEDQAESHFATNLKAGGVLDVVERVSSVVRRRRWLGVEGSRRVAAACAMHAAPVRRPPPAAVNHAKAL